MKTLPFATALFVVLAAPMLPAHAETGETCMLDDDKSRVACLTMIGAVRELMEGDVKKDAACAASNPNDPAVNDDVVAWIKAHSERRDDDLAILIHDAVLSVDPCAQGPLIPTPTEPDDLDVD